jgi:predicted AlkP superfamily pyrophosphatase or phosphodiesterase
MKDSVMLRLRFVLLLGCVPLASAISQAPVTPRIRLVVALTVDQVRPDYLERWRGELPGGLGRLLREGVFFPHGEQDHAITETAPGHSTLMSGRSPASTGIASNDLGVGDPLSPLLGSPATGASPNRFQGTTLFDWMLAHDEATRGLSVSRKDRGAILPMGRARVPVFWYADGSFTTSKYYGDSLPAWIREWNARDPVAALKGTSWVLLRDSASYPEPDNRGFEGGGVDVVFPHRLPDDRARAASALTQSPYMDSLTLDVALQGARALGLGARSGTDFLAISLSTTDAVGHKWGPGSREIHDQVLRLDHWLGWFLDSLATMVPLDQVAVVVSADHGVTEFPEAGNGGRMATPAVVRALNQWAVSRYRINLGANMEGGWLMADTPALAARGVNVDSLAASLAADLIRTPGVRAVYTPKSLAAAPASDLEAGRWRRQIPPGTSWLVAIAVAEGWVWGTSRSSTGHGTTNLTDVRVPMLFRIPGVAPEVVSRTVRTVDIAPTLAAVLGIQPTQVVEGVVLPEVVHLPVRH